MNRTQVRSSMARFSGVALSVLAGIGALASGCGKSGSESSYCDETGCYTCDGYGCTLLPPPSLLDAGAGGLGDAGTRPDADGGAHKDASPDGAAACGGNLGPCPCTTSLDCTGGYICAGGLCTAPTNTCQYSSQCPTGDQCDNGQCVPSCTSSTQCPTDFTCTKGVCVAGPATCTSNSQCTTPDAPYCISGQCAKSCSTDSQCPKGDYCDQGACLLDTRPQPNCHVDSDCNVSDSGVLKVCLNGYCKFECTTNTDCTRVSAFLTVCGKGSVCWSPNEATPACTAADQCKAGQDCISNVCQ